MKNIYKRPFNYKMYYTMSVSLPVMRLPCNNDRDNLIILNTCKSTREWCDVSAVLPEVVAPLLTSLW